MVNYNRERGMDQYGPYGTNGHSPGPNSPNLNLRTYERSEPS